MKKKLFCGVFFRVYGAIVFGLIFSLLILFPLVGDSVQAGSIDHPETDWGIGIMGGKFYGSSLGNLLKFEDTKFLDHYMVGLTVDRTIWRMKSYPLSLQIEGLFAVQFGKDDLFEFALAPRLTWSGFPWNNYVYTRFRAAPIGLSITSSKSKLEKDGDGENLLYYVFFEVALSPPHSKENEFFVRLHHRCAFFDTINDDINGEDFLLFGFRRNF